MPEDSSATSFNAGDIPQPIESRGASLFAAADSQLCFEPYRLASCWNGPQTCSCLAGPLRGWEDLRPPWRQANAGKLG